MPKLDFKVVSDDLRVEREREGVGRPTKPDSPRVLALLEGQTIFVKDASQEDLKTLYTRIYEKHGRRLRRREYTLRRIEGHVLWLE